MAIITINKNKFYINLVRLTKEQTKPWLWEYKILINGYYCGYLAKTNKNINHCFAYSIDLNIDIQATTFNSLRKQLMSLIKEKLQCQTIQQTYL